MFTTIGTALSTLSALQVICVVAITLLVIATPVAIYKIVKNRQRIGSSIGTFVTKIKPSNWGKGRVELVGAES